MVLIVVLYFVSLIGVPLGGLLILCSAWVSRSEKPRRAKVVFALVALFALAILWRLSRGSSWISGYGDAQPSWISIADRISEFAAIGVLAGLAIAALSLVLPHAANKRAGLLGFVGLACLVIAVASFSAIAGVNLGL